MMRINSGRRRQRLVSEINVVPYIDVMLVLLIIFMVTAPLLTQGVKVELPKVASKTLSPEKQLPLIVTVDKTGHYFLNSKTSPQTELSVDVLKAEVSVALKQSPERRVYVRGDRQADYGTVVRAMVVLQQAGASTVGLITDGAN